MLVNFLKRISSCNFNRLHDGLTSNVDEFNSFTML
jgi:hypothetical protein